MAKLADLVRRRFRLGLLGDFEQADVGADRLHLVLAHRRREVALRRRAAPLHEVKEV